MVPKLEGTLAESIVYLLVVCKFLAWSSTLPTALGHLCLGGLRSVGTYRKKAFLVCNFSRRRVKPSSISLMRFPAKAWYPLLDLPIHCSTMAESDHMMMRCIQGSAGTRMPTSCVPIKRCNADAPGWLTEEHPTVAEGQVSRTVCFNWNDCCILDTSIQVRNCSAFYVYYFSGTPNCKLRYCGTD